MNSSSSDQSASSLAQIIPFDFEQAPAGESAPGLAEIIEFPSDDSFPLRAA